MSVDLRKAPFCLGEEAILWVENTQKEMNLDDKVGQLFCVCCREGTREEVEWIYQTLNPGTILLRQLKMDELSDYSKMIHAKSKVPLLVAANLEKGGDGVADEGTLLASPMGIAATGDKKNASRLGEVCAKEGKALGVNWALSPIVDIDYNWRNPITNVRTFGNDPETVKTMGVEFVKAVQKEGLAASPKHFPGDGRDERDQHLCVTINDFSCEEWDDTYGKVYKNCIDEGALTIMVGHIIQLGYERKYRPGVADEELLPATLSPVIMKNLLREKLGFYGLIATDATTMAGYIIPMDRAEALPTSVENGADIILLSRNLQEDIKFIREGLKKGLLTEARLEDAVTRILGLKASLGLHKKSMIETNDIPKEIVGNSLFKQWAKEIADQAITLVKEQKGVFPLTTERYKKILLYGIETLEKAKGLTQAASVYLKVKEMLEKEGFRVEIYQPYTAFEGAIPEYNSITKEYDCILYIANLTTKSNQTCVRIEWAQPFGSNVPVYSNVVPTIFVSVENPYHLVDVPRVKTFINTYSSNDATLRALIDKLMGKSGFYGESPIDPFCGMWDAHL